MSDLILYFLRVLFWHVQFRPYSELPYIFDDRDYIHFFINLLRTSFEEPKQLVASKVAASGEAVHEKYLNALATAELNVVIVL